MDKGTFQADGSMKSEARFDVQVSQILEPFLFDKVQILPQHVANTVVYIAGLPTSVAVLEMNIMAASAPLVGRG